MLVHLYEEKGEALVEDLIGMYAFAILDEKRDRITLAEIVSGETAVLDSASGRRGSHLRRNSRRCALRGLDHRLDIAALAQFLALRYIPDRELTCGN